VKVRKGIPGIHGKKKKDIRRDCKVHRQTPDRAVHRLTFASYLRQRGVDLHTIATLAGHRDLRMIKRYAHLNVDSLREAVSKLETTTILLQRENLKECSGAIAT
jgi:integrase